MVQGLSVTYLVILAFFYLIFIFKVLYFPPMWFHINFKIISFTFLYIKLIIKISPVWWARNSRFLQIFVSYIIFLWDKLSLKNSVNSLETMSHKSYWLNSLTNTLIIFLLLRQENTSSAIWSTNCMCILPECMLGYKYWQSLMTWTSMGRFFSK